MLSTMCEGYGVDVRRDESGGRLGPSSWYR